MKFIHVADTHIGANPEAGNRFGIDRGREVMDAFQKVIDACKREAIELLLIAGDLFHKQPLLRELKEINYLFEQIPETKVVMIAGNHDYISARSRYRDFIFAPNVHMLFDETVDSIYFEDINTEVYGFSYHSQDVPENRLKGLKPGVMERINILLAHGGEDRKLPLSCKEMEEAGFDYIALGHIHTPKVMGDRSAYPGSLEPLDKNETGDHGYYFCEITKNTGMKLGLLNRKYIPSAIRRYVPVSVIVHESETFLELLNEIKNITGKEREEDFIRLSLCGYRDKDLEISVADILKTGRILEVEDHTKLNLDFDKISRENKDNIIGMYVDSIVKESASKEVIDKALYYGIEALLKEKK